MVTPIHQTTTFVPEERDWELVRAGRVAESRFYSRYGNPSVAAVERRIALLEGADEARLFASGNAASHAAILALALPGGHVVASDRLYGGTRAILSNALVASGGAVDFVDCDDESALLAAFRPNTRLVLCESIANPTLEVADVPRLAEHAHARGALLMVDATYATPALQRPLEHGADVVMHSASKYLGGHSDVIAGALASSSELALRFDRWRIDAGGSLDAHAAFLIDRGIKTLAVRMRAHVENAGILARALEAHPKVTRVLYPGLESSAHRARAAQLLAGPGAMVLATCAGGDAEAERVLGRLELAIAAPSLGGVETLVCQPVHTSHAGMTEEQRIAVGILPGSFRISVGIEDAADLVDDFTRALG